MTLGYGAVPMPAPGAGVAHASRRPMILGSLLTGCLFWQAAVFLSPVGPPVAARISSWPADKPNNRYVKSTVCGAHNATGHPLDPSLQKFVIQLKAFTTAQVKIPQPPKRLP
jgi:hypothetical protein